MSREGAGFQERRFTILLKYEFEGKWEYWSVSKQLERFTRMGAGEEDGGRDRKRVRSVGCFLPQAPRSQSC